MKREKNLERGRSKGFSQAREGKDARCFLLKRPQRKKKKTPHARARGGKKEEGLVYNENSSTPAKERGGNRLAFEMIVSRKTDSVHPE